VITNDTDDFIECGCIQTDISDHYPTFAVINNIENILNQNTEFSRLNFSHYDTADFVSDLSRISWQSVYNCEDTDKAYDTFCNLFLNIATKHAPVIKVKSKDPHIRKPWISKGLITSARKKHKLYHRMKRSPNNAELENKYKTYRNILTKLLKAAKKKYYFNKFLSVKNNINKTWKSIEQKHEYVYAQKN